MVKIIIAAVQVSAHLLNVRAIGATVKKTAASAELLFPVSCLKKLDQCPKRGRGESALERVKNRRSQGDVVHLGWPIAPPYMRG
jgi:hypothetical protein